MGRPVGFVGADTEADNIYAESRLRHAYQLAGFTAIQFEMGTGGGGPLLRVHAAMRPVDPDWRLRRGHQRLFLDSRRSHNPPSRADPGRCRGQRRRQNRRRCVRREDRETPRFSVSRPGSEMRSVNKILPVPTWVFSRLERWHHLSFLKAKDTMNMLRSVRAQALERHKIDALIHLVNEDRGYYLHRAVQAMKSDLSMQDVGRFVLSDGGTKIDAVAERGWFEKWIAEELATIEGCVDSLLHDSDVLPADVDMVFLTGGSSFVPAVRRIFERRFGADRIRAGSEFTSVAQGLALKANEIARLS